MFHPALMVLFVFGALLAFATHENHQSTPSPCQDNSRRCEAAQTPPGMRSTYKGLRMVQPKWSETTNRESGLADIGVHAEWKQFIEHR